MHITPAIISAAYEYIRSVPPANEWKLPPAEQVEFRVTRDKNNLGQHTTYRWTKEHIIYLSSAGICHTDTLLKVLAHEMVHAALAQEGNHSQGHGRAFIAKTLSICASHGWDARAF